ncbi:MAG: miaA [Oscillospiraceae bacterium]|jgi:tRNA dimethylallyltransferase|nr:miaA [Oscillospiraceae bacterium]
MSKKIPLLVITGPTASGKTALSIRLAKEYNAEIVSADSMQIYKGMDIATAKPSEEEMEGVPHHLLSFLECDKKFSVVDYVKLAKQKIQEIADKGKLPIVVGGTGLYIHSLIDNITFSDESGDESIRRALEKRAEEEGSQILLDELTRIDPEFAAKLHKNNVIRIIRALEIYQSTGITMTEHQRRSRANPSEYDVCIIGLNYNSRQILYDRINKRVDIMIEQGLLGEAKEILSNSDLKTALQAIGYKELEGYFKGEITLEEAVDKIKQESRRYAKRQLTWFRRDQRIHWVMVDDMDDFCELVEVSKNILENSGIM